MILQVLHPHMYTGTHIFSQSTSQCYACWVFSQGIHWVSTAVKELNIGLRKYCHIRGEVEGRERNQINLKQNRFYYFKIIPWTEEKGSMNKKKKKTYQNAASSNWNRKRLLGKAMKCWCPLFSPRSFSWASHFTHHQTLSTPWFYPAADRKEIHFPNVCFLRHSFVLPEKLSRALRQETSILWAKFCVCKENIQPPHLAPTPVLFGGSPISTAAPRIVLLRATEEIFHWNLLALKLLLPFAPYSKDLHNHRGEDDTR